MNDVETKLSNVTSWPLTVQVGLAAKLEIAVVEQVVASTYSLGNVISI